MIESSVADNEFNNESDIFCLINLGGSKNTKIDEYIEIRKKYDLDNLYK